MNLHLLHNVKPDFEPEKYIVDEGMLQAFEVAYALDQPLLLMGEPGTGKTMFAHKIAYELAKMNAGFSKETLVFNTKTSSAARDLFYMYDSLAHFQDANIRRESQDSMRLTHEFIKLEALGLAIAQTDPSQLADYPLLAGNIDADNPSSVVLIDEIDKAPRDFPNDILNEIEKKTFRIRELSLEVKRKQNTPIVVIMTSNSEKNLPDAFLRRCVFYHIPFPDQEQLCKIAKSALGDSIPDDFLKNLIDKFMEVRKKASRKAPGTAELLAWLRVIGIHKIESLDDEKNREKLQRNLSVLVKTQEDYEAVKDVFAR